MGPTGQGHSSDRDSTGLVVSEPDQLTLEPADVSATQGRRRCPCPELARKTRGVTFRACSGPADVRNLIHAVLNFDAVSTVCLMLTGQPRSRSILMHGRRGHILLAVRPSGHFERKTQHRNFAPLISSAQH